MMVGTSISDEVDGISATGIWLTCLFHYRMVANWSFFERIALRAAVRCKLIAWDTDPKHSRLTKILDAAPKVATVAVASKLGRGYSGDGFRSSFQRLRVRLESEGKIGFGLTFHGLRHTVATRNQAGLSFPPKTGPLFWHGKGICDGSETAFGRGHTEASAGN